ncbi:hypothetical protein BJX76DRAFT_182152 [Aspergillus varians]
MYRRSHPPALSLSRQKTGGYNSLPSGEVVDTTLHRWFRTIDSPKCSKIPRKAVAFTVRRRGITLLKSGAAAQGTSDRGFTATESEDTSSRRKESSTHPPAGAVKGFRLGLSDGQCAQRPLSVPQIYP